MLNTIKFATVSQYIASFPKSTRDLLKEMRAIIKKAAPDAKEVISYNMPAIKINSVLVYYAGYKGHIGFYPTGSGVEKFKREVAGYPTSKGAIRLPLDEPLPAALITKIVKFRVADDERKAQLKSMMKNKK